MGWSKSIYLFKSREEKCFADVDRLSILQYLYVLALSVHSTFQYTHSDERRALILDFVCQILRELQFVHPILLSGYNALQL